MSGIEQSLINLTISALGVIGAVTGALVLVSRKLAANGKPNPGTLDKAHERIDEVIAACSSRHAGIERELGGMSKAIELMQVDITEIKTDVKVIRNGNKR
jgi:hypothetical protein